MIYLVDDAPSFAWVRCLDGLPFFLLLPGEATEESTAREAALRRQMDSEGISANDVLVLRGEITDAAVQEVLDAKLVGSLLVTVPIRLAYMILTYPLLEDEEHNRRKTFTGAVVSLPTEQLVRAKVFSAELNSLTTDGANLLRDAFSGALKTAAIVRLYPSWSFEEGEVWPSSLSELEKIAHCEFVLGFVAANPLGDRFLFSATIEMNVALPLALGMTFLLQIGGTYALGRVVSVL